MEDETIRSSSSAPAGQISHLRRALKHQAVCTHEVRSESVGSTPEIEPELAVVSLSPALNDLLARAVQVFRPALRGPFVRLAVVLQFYDFKWRALHLHEIACEAHGRGVAGVDVAGNER